MFMIMTKSFSHLCSQPRGGPEYLLAGRVLPALVQLLQQRGLLFIGDIFMKMCKLEIDIDP